MEGIEIKDLFFGYNEENVINGLNLIIPKGKYTCIIGHNGSGKSTLAKLITGLETLKSGQIIVDGIELNEQSVREIRKKVGIVFQNPDNQFIGASVKDDIAFGLENMQVPHEDMDRIIHEFATKVGMNEYLEKEPTNLSGGQKQRVALASVLAMNQEIIILDEATSMLDPIGKEEIKQLVQSLNSEKQKTMISITHDIEEAIQSDYVVIMFNGQVYKSGEPKAILSNIKELHQLGLEASFGLELSTILNEAGIIKHTTIYKEELLEQLCQLNLKK